MTELIRDLPRADPSVVQHGTGGLPERMRLDPGELVGTPSVPEIPPGVRRVPEPGNLREDAETLWNCHRIDDESHRVDVAIGLGSHDPSVATYAVQLYREGLFPTVVFTGANAPTTVERFPRGDAVHYRDIALSEGMPDSAILVEPRATNTAKNFEFARDLVAERHLGARTVLILCRPYPQRRAYATARKICSGVEFSCSAVQQSFADYVEAIGDPDRVLSMLVDDTQRITVYADAGHAIPQEIPASVDAAYRRLIDAGYTSRLTRISPQQ